jgi:hypothetical protein
VISLGNSIFVVPRIRNITKKVADCLFKDRKWGPATIIKVLDKNKIKVIFDDKKLTP